MFPTQDWLLTQDEIVGLTGAKQRSKKIRWLVERKFVYEIGFDGEIKVLRAHAEAKMGIIKLEKKKTEPNLAAFKRHLGIA